jgi:hypothetical protein
MLDEKEPEESTPGDRMGEKGFYPIAVFFEEI